MDKKIRSLIKKNDLNEILKLSEEKPNHVIPILKEQDFCIDFRGTSKYAKDIEFLKSSTCSEFQNYLYDIELINLVFAESKNLQDKINQVPPKKVLSLMLFLGSTMLDEAKSQKQLKLCKELNADSFMGYEKAGDLISTAIKSLLYNEKIFKNGVFINKLSYKYLLFVKSKHKKTIYEYIYNSMLVSSWYETYSYWKKGWVSIQRDKNEKLVVKYLDKDKISLQQYPVIKDKIYRAMYENHSIQEYFLQSKEPNALEAFKYVSNGVIKKYFYSNSDEILINDIKIKDWISSYNALLKISQNDIDKLRPIFYVESLIYDKKRVKTREQWIQLFIKEGVEKEIAKKIFEYFIFNTKSPDLYDSPLIPLPNGKYALFRTLTKLSSPAYSLISRFNSKDFRTDIKGKNFERYFQFYLNRIGIPNVSLHNKVDGQEYECDSVFFLDNTFVFCECKNRAPHDYETTNQNNYCNDIKQLNRISSFYQKNIGLVLKAFKDIGVNLPDYVRYSFKNIVIHSRAVDGVIIQDNTYVMDFDNFTMPFDRGITWEEFIKDKSLKNVFTGYPTIDKLFTFYESKFFIFDYRNCMQFFEHDIYIGALKIHTDYFIIKGIFTNDFFKHVSKCNRINIFLYNGATKDEAIELANKMDEI